jgi:hypothetical protein
VAHAIDGMLMALTVLREPLFHGAVAQHANHPHGEGRTQARVRQGTAVSTRHMAFGCLGIRDSGERALGSQHETHRTEMRRSAVRHGSSKMS